MMLDEFLVFFYRYVVLASSRILQRKMSLFQRGRSRQEEARHRREVNNTLFVCLPVCYQTILSLL